MAFRTRKTMASTALVATVTGCAALTLAGPASAEPQLVKDNYLEVPDCHTTTEVCAEIPSVSYWFNYPNVIVTFTANQNHCADMIDHIMVDGYEWGFRVVGPGQSDGGQLIPLSPVPGRHTIGVKAEGIKGGCNPGSISLWGGNLHIVDVVP